MTEPMEPVLEPGLRIVDAHHHLMDGPGHRYTIDDYAADCALGHDVRASVYIEVRQHYRDGGPEHLRPFFETGLELFGTGRVILESNYPVDGQTTTFTALWNAFKRLTGGCSDEEKRLLYRENANRAYRLGLET